MMNNKINEELQALAERTARMREQELLWVPNTAPRQEQAEAELKKEPKKAAKTDVQTDEVKTKVKKAVGEFCKRNQLDPVLGKGGNIWLKAGQYRAVGIEPKKYGWVVSINNRLFDDVNDIETCQMVMPTEGEWFWSKNTLTKNMWKVKSLEALLNFLAQ